MEACIIAEEHVQAPANCDRAREAKQVPLQRAPNVLPKQSVWPCVDMVRTHLNDARRETLFESEGLVFRQLADLVVIVAGERSSLDHLDDVRQRCLKFFELLERGGSRSEGARKSALIAVDMLEAALTDVVGVRPEAL